MMPRASEGCLRNSAGGRWAPFRVSVGVASGPALCGVYGNECRQEYTVLGNVMNLAARLMQRQEGVLCDADRSACRRFS